MQVDEALIKSVAANARLELTAAEIKKFVPQFQEILHAFSALNDVNVDGISPTPQPTHGRNALRDDVPNQSLSQEEALRNAPHKKEGYIKGPLALE